MNDLDICKRIAKIEGVDYFSSEGIISAQNELGMCREYDPLTDDALCFHLMVKYKLSLIAPEGEQTNWDCVISDILTCDENPNKAICLAIIEANKALEE